MKLNNLFTIVALIIFSMATGCSNKVPVKFNPQTAKSDLPAVNTLATAQILQSYYHLKDALVATDSQKAGTALSEMNTAVNNYMDKLGKNRADSLISAQTDVMMISYGGRLSDQIKRIQEVNEKDCEQMRIYFKPLSDTLYTLLKDIRIKDIHAYHQYCPMAMNERGAYWLSASPEIENPYFGQKMLTCGELVDTIQ